MWLRPGCRRISRILRRHRRRSRSETTIRALRRTGRRAGLPGRSSCGNSPGTAHQVLARIVIKLPKRKVGLIVYHLDGLSARFTRHSCNTAPRDGAHTAALRRGSGHAHIGPAIKCRSLPWSPVHLSTPAGLRRRSCRVRAGVIRRDASQLICLLQLFGLSARQERRTQILIFNCGVRRTLPAIAAACRHRRGPSSDGRHDDFRC